MQYLSNLSAEGSKHLSSLMVRSVGGGSFGVKLSTGDNEAFATVVSVLCEEIARRTAEEELYNCFEQGRFKPKTDAGGTGEGNDPVAVMLGCQAQMEKLLHRPAGK